MRGRRGRGAGDVAQDVLERLLLVAASQDILSRCNITAAMTKSLLPATWDMKIHEICRYESML